MNVAVHLCADDDSLCNISVEAVDEIPADAACCVGCCSVSLRNVSYPL